MADQDRPPVGSVAEEAARLLDALGDWGAGAAQAAGHRHAHGDSDGDGDSDSDGDGDERTTGRCPTCGAENGTGQAVVCQLCPVCQGLGMLRSVKPETVDRIADLAGAIAATLRDLAGQWRESPPGRSTRVQDIPVEDVDGDDVGGDDVGGDDVGGDDVDGAPGTATP